MAETLTLKFHRNDVPPKWGRPVQIGTEVEYQNRLWKILSKRKEGHEDYYIYVFELELIETVLKPACGNCAFFSEAPKVMVGEAAYFICRRFPPVDLTWSKPTATDWCGEFLPKSSSGSESG